MKKREILRDPHSDQIIGVITIETLTATEILRKYPHKCFPKETYEELKKEGRETIFLPLESSPICGHWPDKNGIMGECRGATEHHFIVKGKKADYVAMISNPGCSKCAKEAENRIKKKVKQIEDPTRICENCRYQKITNDLRCNTCLTSFEKSEFKMEKK